MAVLLARAVKIIPSPVPQSIRFFSGLTAILFTVGFVCYGLFNANQVKNVSYNIQTKNNSLTGEMKIVLLSDLHFGAVNSGRNLEKIVHVINDLKPDIVCIAGDIFDNNYYAIQNPSKAIELLKNITANYGVFACLGNHDAGSTFPEMTRFIEQSNIKLLKDEYAVINDRLVLIGRLDRSPIGGITGLHRKNFQDILTSIDTDLPIVVMDHNPSSIGQYGKEVDLILSGHTHKGQIFPANLITKKLFTVDYGHYQKDSDSPHVVVSSGVGTWGMPMRVGTHSEIASITLR
jgi:predicted MPP superfamily phosphohydrolase